MVDIDSPLSAIVGGRTVKPLERAFGIRAVGDLLRHYPRRMAERGELTDLGSLRVDDEVTVLAEVRRCTRHEFGRPGRSRPAVGMRLEVEVGDGLIDRHHMGPMANPRRPQAVEALIGDAVSRGATLRTGGERHGKEGFFYQPTVLSDVPATSRIMTEEPFGPVAVLAPFATCD